MIELLLSLLLFLTAPIILMLVIGFINFVCYLLGEFK